MYDLQPIIHKILERIEAHKVGEGQYARWLWQDAKETRELGVNPYGCADAANLLYMLGHAPLYQYMAGGFHYLFNHESTHMPVRYPERIIDSCIHMYLERKLDKLFGKRAGLVEIDWIYCLTRACEQTHFRYDEAMALLRQFAEEYMDFWNTVDWETNESVNDLHFLFGGVCALAELQQVLRGELRSDRPLKLVLDRRPFI